MDRPRTAANALAGSPNSCFWHRLHGGRYKHGLTGCVVAELSKLTCSGLLAGVVGFGKTLTMMALLRISGPGRTLIVCAAKAAHSVRNDNGSETGSVNWSRLYEEDRLCEERRLQFV